MGLLKVDLVAADGKVWEGEANSVHVPAEAGPMTVLPRHAPILASLGEGELRIDGTDGRFTTQSSGGFITVEKNVVTIAVDSASTK